MMEFSHVATRGLEYKNIKKTNYLSHRGLFLLIVCENENRLAIAKRKIGRRIAFPNRQLRRARYEISQFLPPSQLHKFRRRKSSFSFSFGPSALPSLPRRSKTVSPSPSTVFPQSPREKKCPSPLPSPPLRFPLLALWFSRRRRKTMVGSSLSLSLFVRRLLPFSLFLGGRKGERTEPYTHTHSSSVVPEPPQRRYGR